MMPKNKILKFLALVFLYTALPAALVLAQAAPRVRIMEVDNINFGTWAFSSLDANDPVCAFRNGGVSAYRITATDDSTLPASEFLLQNAADTAAVAYTPFWSNTTSPGSITMSDGVVVNASGANNSTSNCGGGDSANIRVTIANSALAAVPAGTYTATLTLFMQP